DDGPVALLGLGTELLEFPGADAGHLAGVGREVAIGIDGLLGDAEHAHERPQRLGVRDVFAAMAQRRWSKLLRERTKRAPRSTDAEPAGLIVDDRGIDPRTVEEGTCCSLPFLGTDSKKVGLEDGGPKFLFSPPTNGSARQ